MWRERTNVVLRERIFCKLTLLFFLIVLVSSAGGQAAQQAASPAPVANANVDEISLDLVVHDRQDKPVLDLQPGEIAVSDSDSPVKLSSLRLVKATPGSESLITLLFDQLNPAQMKNAHGIAEKVLKLLPKSGFSLAVLNVQGHLRLQQGFTDDRKEIELAINAITQTGKHGGDSTSDLPEQQLTARARSGADSAGRPVSAREHALAQMLVSALEDSKRMVQDQRTQPALAGLLALARSQQKIKERKALIFFTQGRQMDSRANEEIESIIGAANRAGVSIYAIDLDAIGQRERRKMAQAMGAGSDANDSALGWGVTSMGNSPGSGNNSPAPGTLVTNSPSGTNNGPQSLAGSSNDRLTQSLQTGTMSPGVGSEVLSPDMQTAQLGPMADLAKRTGGIWIASDDNLRKPLDRLVQDLTIYYEASYPSPVKEYDGAFRATTVRPLRAGLNVRSMAGYFAVPPGNGSFAKPFELPLLKMMSAAPWPADVAFRASVLRLGEMPDGNANAVVIEAPLSDVEMREDTVTKLYSAHLSIVAEIKDKAGAVLAHFSEDILRHGALNGMDAAKLDFVTFQRHFSADPGEYILEAAVLDANSGKAGAQRVPFVIPNRAAFPSLSDLVLVRKGEPFSAETDPLEPLRYSTYKVTPNLSGQAPREAKNVLLFLIVHPDPSATDAAILNMQLLKNGAPLPNLPIAPRQFNGSAASPFLAGFPVKLLAEGQYELKATLSQHGKTSVSSISFALAAPPPVNQQTASAGADLQPLAADPDPTGPLSVTFPTSPIQRPPAEELKSLLADATEHAIGYSDSLPNFICAEVTRRSIDPNGKGKWVHMDTITEMVIYRDNEENRTTLKLNGKNSNADRDILPGVLSIGEFGILLDSVFKPSSKAAFEWKETGMLGGGTVQVFDYHVALQNSNFDLVIGGGDHTTVAYHGQVFIDSATRTVRRITAVAEGMPKNYRIRATSIGVDYDYIAINKHDYLLPVGGKVTTSLGQYGDYTSQLIAFLSQSGKVTTRLGQYAAVLNEFEFRNYRHFGSTMKMIYSPGAGDQNDTPEGAPGQTVAPTVRPN